MTFSTVKDQAPIRSFFQIGEYACGKFAEFSSDSLCFVRSY